MTTKVKEPASAKLVWLASMQWPERIAPVCVGGNKQRTYNEALRLLRDEYGTGDVLRQAAMCSMPITGDYIDMQQIPFIE